MKYLPSEIEINGVTYYSGLELASKQLDWYNLGLAAGKSESYDKGWTDGYKEGKERRSPYLVAPVSEYPNPYNVGYEAGKKDEYMKGYCDGYEQCKHDGISPKEIPGEYLSHIEEAYDDGYKEGYMDCREVAKMLNKYGIDEDGPCNDCKEEPGRDEEDGDYVGPEHPEYDKGYYAGWEDGKNHIMQFIGNESSR
jgi:hypothetical protein